MSLCGFLGVGDREPVVGYGPQLMLSACRPSSEGGQKVSTAHEWMQLQARYRNEIGIPEATGRKDGPRVAEYLRYCGLGEGYAWCAAFVSWCHGQAGYAAPRNAWSPALFPLSRMIWSNDEGTRSIPKEGDVFGIYYANLRRIAHVGFVDGWDGTWCITVEGNTGPPADGANDARGGPANPIRAGPSTDGVFRKRRPVRTIHAVARWTE